ncbi:hypothetical protein [Candidatus Phytoplasma sp. AldY-WA1]|uniref:hypothetical protein n=1 Tax=Candidatus Phytoplasma sp. AldY-WA1 TaxID=2852100 RepID=UPI00254E8443|nr:hypothetical protein [Candidatus Phytoplasma sp. AldY-WA1]
MISLTTLFFQHYKIIFSFVAIIPIIFLIYGIYKFSLKKIIISVTILITLLGIFIYITKKVPLSKYTPKTFICIDEKLKQYDNLLSNYDGLNTKLYDEAKKIATEIKELSETLELTQEEKEKVEKHLEENENKIKEIKEKCKFIEQNICILNGQLIDLEKQKLENEAKTKQIQEQLAKELDEEVRKKLNEEIAKLQKEHRDIIEKIVGVKREIGKLKNKQEMYNDMLKRAETLKNSLQRDFDNFTTDEQAILLKINNRKDRLDKIEAQIKENKAEMQKIEEEKKEIAMKRSFAEACRAACITYEKEHEFNFGNFTNALFKGFDMYTDYATGRCLVKTAGICTKAVGGQITKTALYFNEGNKIFNTLQRQFCKEDGSPKMIDESTYKSIVEKTDKDFEDCADRYKECKTKGDQLLKDSNPANLEQAANNEKKQIKGIRNENRLELQEFKKIIEDLENKLQDINNLEVQRDLEQELEETRARYNELIEANKNQLKQKSPSFNARDNHARNMRYTRYGINIVKK